MRPRTFARALISTLLFTAPAWAGAPEQGEQGDQGDHGEQSVWLVVESPTAGERQEGGLDWVRVAGRAGAGERVDYDIALVLDISGSTAIASGSDVDGDGKLGKAKRRPDNWRRFNPAHQSTDSGDTILAAELLASRRLVESLSPSGTRFAVVTFADRARLEAPLSADPNATFEALDALNERFGAGLTNLADALDVATQALVAGAESGSTRKPVILLLSDGYPTFPGGEREAGKQALAMAEAAGQAGIEIVSFGLGLEPIEQGDVYAEIAAQSGGRYVRLERAGDVVYALPGLVLSSVPDVRIENASLAAPGRATRILADGSFDGFVPLAPGVNLLRVLARSEGGAERQVDRLVEYVPRMPRNDAERRELAARDASFQRQLTERTIAVDLVAELAAKQAARSGVGQEKEVRLEVAEEVETAAE